MNSLTDLLTFTLRARLPVIGLETHEEQRVIDALWRIALQMGENVNVHLWRCTTGLDCTDAFDIRDPLDALSWLGSEGPAGIFVFCDLDPFLVDPEVTRSLRDAAQTLQSRQDQVVVLLSPELVLPVSLSRTVSLFKVPMPDEHELGQVISEVAINFPNLSMDDADKQALVPRLRGLTLNEVRNTLYDAFSSSAHAEHWPNAIVRAKGRLQLTTGIKLQWVDVEDQPALVGLDVLNQWIDDRNTWQGTQAALLPKGLLLMGISGCGKSLAVKSLANRWQLPLFRLDMTQLYSSNQPPEKGFQEALAMIEALSPAILWLDEIENSFTALNSDPTQARLFANFLTWLQEKPASTFVAATANRIELLPPELIRKGRFDEVFFLDLPEEGARANLFESHLVQAGHSAEGFDFARLAQQSEGYNAAEIAQSVRDACLSSNTPTSDQLIQLLKRTVPLSQSRADEIKALKDWAWDRAVNASSGEAINDDW